MKISKSKATEKLRTLVDQGQNLQANGTGDPAFKKWHSDCDAALRNIFGADSAQLAQFGKVFFSPRVLSTYGDNSAAYLSAYRNGMSSALSKIAAWAGEVADFWPDDPEEASSRPIASANRDTVFIIHGRDLNLADTVARFLEKRGLTAVILHEQPNMGRTVIEKFEAHAAPCAFAVSLFTADDEGRLSEEGAPVKKRARQNVVLETGYFVHALSRKNVAILHHKDVELPSDFGGLLYIPLEGSWRELLAKELEAAGVGKRTE